MLYSDGIIFAVCVSACVRVYARPSVHIRDTIAGTLSLSLCCVKSLQPTLKSDEIPADWDAKPVKTVVGKNFYDVVVKSDRNVLIQFCKLRFHCDCLSLNSE